MNNRIGKGSQMQILEKVKDFVKQTTIRQRITAGVVALLLIVGAVSVALSQTRQVSESVGKVSVRVKADKTSVERKSEAEKAEAKAKAGSDAKAKEEADKKAQEQAQVVAQQQAQAEQQAQAQAVAQQQQQAQAVAEQSQAQATEQAQAVAPPQQAPQQTPPAQQQPPQYIDWSQAGRDKTEYNASQGLDANGNVSQTVGGSPWGK